MKFDTTEQSHKMIQQNEPTNQADDGRIIFIAAHFIHKKKWKLHLNFKYRNLLIVSFFLSN